MSESAIIHAALQWLFLHGLEPIRNNSGGFTKRYTSKKTGKTTSSHIRFGRKGTGDILVCNKAGKWVELEGKIDGANQSEDQIKRQAHVEACGGVYIVFRSVDDLEARKSEVLGRIATPVAR